MSKPKDSNPSPGGLIRLTAWCKAARRAGKLAPADLCAVLARLDLPSHPDLLVGISGGDGAGVFRLSDDLAIVNTVDLFTPMVDDPFTYGQISAAGALSHVYAMGGLPRTALCIVCWPQTGLPNGMLAEIIRGAADKAREAGAAIVGGHYSVANENEEVAFGMAVTGVIDPRRIVRNVGAQADDAMVLTKALGTGILMTAFKRDQLADEPYQAAVRSMTQLNAAAASAMLKYDVHAAIQIAGFSLLDHALKMAEGSAVTIVFEESDLPILPGVLDQCRAGLIPRGGERSREYSAGVCISDEVSDEIAAIAVEPESCGGLLIAIPDQESLALLAELQNCGYRDAAIVGRVTPRREQPIELV